MCLGFVQMISSEPLNLLEPTLVVHHHVPECHAKQLGCYLQGEGHTEGLFSQDVTVSTIFYVSTVPSELILLQPNLVCW